MIPRIPLPFLLLAASLALRTSAWPGDPPPGYGPVVGPLATSLDSLIPGATGVFLAEVTRLRDVDERPSDGDLYQEVRLKVFRSTGLTHGSVYLVRASGGLDVRGYWGWKNPRPSPPPPRFSLKPDDLRLGRKYWFATASKFDVRYPEGLTGCWPADSIGAPPLLEAAVDQNAYAWHPETWPSGYVTGWIDQDSSSTLRVWRRGRLLWERRLDGLLTHSPIGWYVNRGYELGSLHPPGISDSAWVLLAEVSEELPAGNRFGLAALPWRITHVIDLDTGKVVASRAWRMDERVFQAYDAVGRLAYERIQDALKRGGVSVGAEGEDWVRRVERWLDPGTGRVVREEVRRFAMIPISSTGTASTWVLVDREHGLAAGSLRSGEP